MTRRTCKGSIECVVPFCACASPRPKRSDEVSICACCRRLLCERERKFLYFHHSSRPTCFRGKPWTREHWLRDIRMLLRAVAEEKSFMRSEAARAGGDA